MPSRLFAFRLFACSFLRRFVKAARARLACRVGGTRQRRGARPPICSRQSPGAVAMRVAGVARYWRVQDAKSALRQSLRRLKTNFAEARLACVR